MNLSVLQWNVWFQEDVENVVKALKEIDADVICLQELTKYHPGQSHSDTIRYISEELGMNVYASKPMGREDVARKQFNAIFSRLQLTEQNQAWINIPVGTGGPSDEFRAYIEVTVNVGKSKLRIATTHMSYIDRFKITNRKKQETDNLVQHIKDKNSLILTGDFNASPDSYTVQSITKYLSNAGPDFKQYTWTTKPFKHGDFEEKKLNWRLDYVFASSRLKVTSSKIVDTDFSDHLPILTVFSIG